MAGQHRLRLPPFTQHAPLVQPLLPHVQQQGAGPSAQHQHKAQVLAVYGAESGPLAMAVAQGQQGVVGPHLVARQQQQPSAAVTLEPIRPLDGAKQRVAVDPVLPHQVDGAHEGHQRHLLAQGEQGLLARLIDEGKERAVGTLGVGQHGLHQGHRLSGGVLGLTIQSVHMAVVDGPAAEREGQAEQQQCAAKTEPGTGEIQIGQRHRHSGTRQQTWQPTLTADAESGPNESKK